MTWLLILLHLLQFNSLGCEHIAVAGWGWDGAAPSPAAICQSTMKGNMIMKFVYGYVYVQCL